MSTKRFMLVRELLFLSQLTTTPIYTFPQKSKKCDFVNVSVVKKLYGHNGHNVSHLIFSSCYVRDTYCSRHLNFAIFFLYCEIREINVSRKFHLIRYP